jgi:hypothetical protein
MTNGKVIGLYEKTIQDEPSNRPATQRPHRADSGWLLPELHQLHRRRLPILPVTSAGGVVAMLPLSFYEINN